MQTTSISRSSSSAGWSHILAGPVIWFTYFMVGYLLLEAVCNAKPQFIERMPPMVLATIIIVLTLVAFVAAVYAAWVSYRAWVAAQRRNDDDVHEPDVTEAPSSAGAGRTTHDKNRFMSLSGVLLSGLFAFIILATGFPALILDPCW
jgi:hypothetical protein